jgi:hypothetical protein
MSVQGRGPETVSMGALLATDCTPVLRQLGSLDIAGRTGRLCVVLTPCLAAAYIGVPPTPVNAGGFGDMSVHDYICGMTGASQLGLRSWLTFTASSNDN